LDLAAFTADGREGVVEVALLGVPVPPHRQQRVLEVDRLARRLHLTEERLDRFPDLGPHVDGAPPERPRMLAAWNRAPGVVVKQDELRPPVDRDREARSGADAERRAQALGPCLDWTERRRSPVEGTHSDSQVAAADERVARSGNCRHTRTRLWGRSEEH